MGVFSAPGGSRTPNLLIRSWGCRFLPPICGSEIHVKPLDGFLSHGAIISAGYIPPYLGKYLQFTQIAQHLAGTHGLFITSQCDDKSARYVKPHILG